MESFFCLFLWECGDTTLSVLEKYMPFSGFCTMPWRMRSPIRVFISIRFVSIQLPALDCGVKLKCAAKTLVGVYIFLFSKQLSHIFVIKLLQTFQSTSFIIKVYIHSVYTGKCRSWTCHTVWYKRLRQIRHFFTGFTFMHNTACIWPTVWIFQICIKRKLITFLREYPCLLSCVKLLRYPLL